MKNFNSKRWRFMNGFMLAVLTGIMVFGSAPVVRADERGFRQGKDQQKYEREFRHETKQYKNEHGLRQETRQHKFLDSRYHHNHYYPTHGRIVNSLPRGYRGVVHGRAQYYYSGGVWYRPEGPRFSIVAPAIGIVIPFLPPFYSTIWVGSMPYYYANEVYYARSGNGYAVVDPPAGEFSEAPPSVPMPSDKLYIYPRRGQSEQQQANDRFDCHRWAAGQTGYDPTQPLGGVSEAETIQKRAEYQRAMGACLDARGYTVK